MLLRELVADPSLRLTVLTGEHALDRPLLSVTTIDLLDPRRYLRPGALVLTGLMWHHGPADSETFVRALTEYDVVALAAGEAAWGSVPDDLVDACRRHGVALLKVPVEVAFSQVTDVVSAGREAEREGRLAAVLDRQRRMLSAVAAGEGVGSLLDLVEDEVGFRPRVLTPTGRDVSAAESPLPAEDTDALTRAFLTADRLPVVVDTLDGACSVVPVESRLGHRVTRWFLVCAGDHGQWSDDVRATIDELVTALALERSRLDDGHRIERRLADEIVGLVVAGDAARPETATRMRDLGIDPAGPFLAMVAAVTDRPDLVEVARTVLHDLALGLDSRPLIGADADRAIGLVPASGGEDVDRLRTGLARLAPGLGTRALAVGISAVSAPDALAGALEEARHAQRLASLQGGPLSVLTADEVTSHVVLLAAVPDDVRRTFAGRVLQPVIDHDARHGTNLLETLRAFLEVDCSWSRCATALHLHVNTVRYRIGKVEQITGRDLSRTEDRVDVFLALRTAPSP
jgi:sugar diacid utilization regulator